jgi:hypothetical protein
MRAELIAAWDSEWRLAAEARTSGDLARAFHHLERAHVLGQRSTHRHVRSHLGMLAIGWQRRDRREVLGQFARLPAALLFSSIWVPAGNTGGANVRAMQPMPIPDDLRALLADHGR